MALGEDAIRDDLVHGSSGSRPEEPMNLFRTGSPAPVLCELNMCDTGSTRLVTGQHRTDRMDGVDRPTPSPTTACTCGIL